jgi:hypothetical protein
MSFPLRSTTVCNTEGSEDFFDEETIHNSILSILCEQETIWREPAQPASVQPVVSAELAGNWFKNLKSSEEKMEFLFCLLESLSSRERTMLKGHLCADSACASSLGYVRGKERKRNVNVDRVKVPSSPSSSCSSSSSCGFDLRTDLAGNVPSWLRWHRLHKYTDKLGYFSFEMLINLTDTQLESLGVEAVGARRKLLRLFNLIKEH